MRFFGLQHISVETECFFRFQVQRKQGKEEKRVEREPIVLRPQLASCTRCRQPVGISSPFRAHHLCVRRRRLRTRSTTLGISSWIPGSYTPFWYGLICRRCRSCFCARQRVGQDGGTLTTLVRHAPRYYEYKSS